MTGKERREQLLDIGRRLFAERGFEGTSIEEIAAQAGVSKPVVYEHFGGKEGLYAVVVDREVERLLTMATTLLDGGHTREKFEAAAVTLLRYIDDNADGFRILVRDSNPGSGTGTYGTLLSDIAGQVEYILADFLASRGHDPKLAPTVRPDGRGHGRVHRAVVARRAQAQAGRGRRQPDRPGLERPLPAGRERTEREGFNRALAPAAAPGARVTVPAPAGADGRPSATHARYPPITSVARCRPRSCSAAAARLEVYPSTQKTMIRWSYPVTQGSRASEQGSRRHSRWLRSTTVDPGISPCAARCAAGLMSTSTPSPDSSPKACRGVSRTRRARAEARISSMVRAPCGRTATMPRRLRYPA